MGVYVALTNVPGYLPMDDQPPMFDGENAVRDAWDYLATERMNAEDDTEHDGYSATKNTLDMLAAGELWEDSGLDDDGTGTVTGGTPGYDGDHDQGIAYTVQTVACSWTARCGNTAVEMVPHPILTTAGNDGIPACERCASRAKG